MQVKWTVFDEITYLMKYHPPGWRIRLAYANALSKMYGPEYPMHGPAFINRSYTP